MITDAFLMLEPLAGTNITASAVSTNVIDLSVARDMGGGHYPDPDLIVTCLTSFTAASAAATLNIQVKGAPDNGSGSPGGYLLFQETGVIPLGQLVAGMKLMQIDLGSISQPIIPPVNTTLASAVSSNASTLPVASATGVQQGQLVNVAGVTPGTTVASISGNTITLSANTTAAIASGTAVSFTVPLAMPRFLELSYVVANGPFTAGAIWAGVVLDADQQPLYKAGYVFPSGT